MGMPEEVCMKVVHNCDGDPELCAEPIPCPVHSEEAAEARRKRFWSSRAPAPANAGEVERELRREGQKLDDSLNALMLIAADLIASLEGLMRLKKQENDHYIASLRTKNEKMQEALKIAREIIATEDCETNRRALHVIHAALADKPGGFST